MNIHIIIKSESLAQIRTISLQKYRAFLEDCFLLAHPVIGGLMSKSDNCA